MVDLGTVDCSALLTINGLIYNIIAFIMTVSLYLYSGRNNLPVVY